jgi:G3E family GTPase
MIGRQMVAVLAVATLLVTAGCAATTSGTPPGLSEENVTDANALVASHTDTLDSQSFTVEVTREVEEPNGELDVRFVQTYRVDPQGTTEGRLVSNTTLGADPPERYTDGNASRELDAYRDGNVTYLRVTRGDNVSYQRTGAFTSPVTLGRMLQRRTINALSDRQNATVRSVTVDGERHYRVHAYLNDTQVRTNAVVNMTVSPDGLVRELTFRRIVPIRSTKRITTHVRFDNIGETIVERPEWYETAQNATGSG